jgi:hypothetical protein
LSALEIAANAVITVSIWLAARNHVYTWPTGIVGLEDLQPWKVVAVQQPKFDMGFTTSNRLLIPYHRHRWDRLGRN